MSRFQLVLFALLASWLGLSLVTPFAHAQYGPLNRRQAVMGVEGSDDPDEIETDRDSFTPATTITPRRRAIIETSYSFIDNRTVPETHSFPELLVRYGASDWFELRVGWNYEVGGAGSPVSGNVPSDLSSEAALERESRVLYGAKIQATNQEGWIPQSAIIVQGFTPTSGEVTDSQATASYVFGWTLPNEWKWDTSLRYSTGTFADDHFNVWAPSTVLKIPVCEQWNAHVEYFGIFSCGRTDETVQNFISTGVHYLITEDLEIGTRTGWGMNQEAPNFFANVGLGWRY